MKDKIIDIAKQFKFKGQLINIEENTQGNINTTYLLTFNDHGTINRYLLQKINNYVFKDPYKVMHNIELITNHINKKLLKEKDYKHQIQTIIKTIEDKIIYTLVNEKGETEYYRAYNYIDNCQSYDECYSTLIAYNAGRGFGIFHRLLSDFSVELLDDTIPDFHNTLKRLEDLKTSIKNDVSGRHIKYSKEIADLMTKEKEISLIWQELGTKIPIRVTHNDTKINNILLSTDDQDVIAVIDLDTVMKGSVLFDIGDGIRSTCSSCDENETDKNKIHLDLDLTKAYIKGYLQEMANYLTVDEVKYIALSIKTLTYELAIRFLTDYINHDVYFKIKYKEHNSDRFLNQYTLLEDIEKKMDIINDFVWTTYEQILEKAQLN